MHRSAALVILVSIITSLASFGFPAPKPKEPQNVAELIVGHWEAVIQAGSGASNFNYHFTANGEFKMSLCDLVGEPHKYSTFTDGGKSWVEIVFTDGQRSRRQIQSISAQEVTFVQGNSKTTLRRKQP